MELGTDITGLYISRLFKKLNYQSLDDQNLFSIEYSSVHIHSLHAGVQLGQALGLHGLYQQGPHLCRTSRNNNSCILQSFYLGPSSALHTEYHIKSLKHILQVPLLTFPPEIIAPACPILLPGGAVTPAMNDTTGFLSGP